MEPKFFLPIFLLISGISLSAQNPLASPDVRWSFNDPYAVEIKDEVNNKYPLKFQPGHVDSRYYAFNPRVKGVEGTGFFISHRADLETDLKLPENFTLSFWFQTPEQAGQGKVSARNLVKWNKDITLDVNNDKIEFKGAGKADFVPGKWHHLAFNQQNGQAEFYLDGKVIFKTKFDPGSNVPLAFFAGTKNDKKNTAGTIDEVRVYFKNLTPEQIRQLASPEYYKTEKQLLADAGIDHTVWTDSEGKIQLKGKAEGSTKAKWQVVSKPEGGTAKFADPESLTTDLAVKGPGKYILELTVADDNGRTAKDHTSVLVFSAQKTRKSKLHQAKALRTFPGGKAVEPLAYFKFDDPGKTITKSTDGKYSVDIKPTQQKHGRAIITDEKALSGAAIFYDKSGRNHETNFGPILNGKRAGTISFWLQPAEDDRESLLFQVPGAWEFKIGEELKWKGIGAGSNTPGCKLPANQWSHLIISWDAETARVFYNGEQIYYDVVNPADIISNGDLLFNNSTPSHKKYAGYLDDLAVYDFMINPDEARLLHDKGPEAFKKRLPYGKDYVYGYSPEYMKKHLPVLKHELITEGYARDRISKVPAPYIHPRIYFGPEDLENLRVRLRYTKAGRSRMNAAKTIISARLDDLLKDKEQPFPIFFEKVEGNIRGGQAVGGYALDSKGLCGPYILESFRCLIENDEKTALRLADMLERQADVQLDFLKNNRKAKDKNWQSSTHNVVGRRTSAIMYDLLYSWLTEAQRTKIRQAIADSINDKWSTGLDAAYGTRGHNWACWMSGDIMINAMAIEGEDGFDPYLLERCITFYKQFCFTAAGPRDGSPWPGMAKHSITTGKLLALARRGEHLLATPMVLNHVREYNLHCFQPFGSYQIVDDLHGGSMNKVHLGDMSVIKMVYPEDPVVDYVYRLGTGDEYENHGVGGTVYGYTSPLVGLITATDWTGPGDINKHAQQAFKGKKPSRLFNYNNTFSTRTGWDENALLLWFWPRMLGGHSMPARGTFVLSALGREWATYPPYGPQANPDYHSLVLVDNDKPGTEWSRVINHRETDLVSSVTADLICPYSKQQPEQLSQNWFRFEKEPFPWEDIPTAMMPNWLNGNFPDNPLVEEKDMSKWRPENFRSAYRSATLVRGKHPYVLIVDDFQKDDKPHNWRWQLALNTDLGDEVYFNGKKLAPTTTSFEKISKKKKELTPDANGESKFVQGNGSVYDVIVADPGTKRRLLIRMFRINGSPGIGVEGKAIDEDKKGQRIYFGNNRVVFKVNAGRPDFAVMLYPFIEGQPLPTVEQQGDSYTFSWLDQKDTVKLDQSNGQATQVTISRDGKEILAKSASRK